VVALVVPIVWIGVQPDALLRRLDASMIELVRVMEARGADVASVNGGQSAASMAAEWAGRLSPRPGELEPAAGERVASAEAGR
jgi:hypothetical protein